MPATKTLYTRIPEQTYADLQEYAFAHSMTLAAATTVLLTAALGATDPIKRLEERVTAIETVLGL